MIGGQTSKPGENAVSTGGPAPEDETDILESDSEAAGNADNEHEELQGPSESCSESDIEPPGRPNVVRRVAEWLGRRWIVVIVVIVFTVSGGAAEATYWLMHRPDTRTDAAVRTQVLDAATQGMTSLLNYAPESFDKDFTTAKSHLTGEFLTYYIQFTDKIVAPAVKQREVKTNATVAQAAISQLTPDKATVLLFVNQVTTSKDKADPALANSSILVSLTRARNAWLISEVNPV